MAVPGIKVESCRQMDRVPVVFLLYKFCKIWHKVRFPVLCACFFAKKWSGAAVSNNYFFIFAVPREPSAVYFQMKGCGYDIAFRAENDIRTILGPLRF